jgi:tetratricopeptide (TPR) repeat protein
VSGLEQARAHYEAEEFAKAREAALAGLRERPDDPELLRLAGKAGVELGEADAIGQLRKATELSPDDADAWHDLGEGLVIEGENEQATDAFKRALELNPEDEIALTHLGHAQAALGRDDDAISTLSQAAEKRAPASSAAISLVEMYRSVGQPEQALAAAQNIAEADPNDVVSALDVAELSLELGRLDEARTAFERLREIDDIAEHEVYALHGLIQVALQQDDTDRARELAAEAAGIEGGRSAQVLRFFEPDGTATAEAAGEEPPQPAPSREDVEAALKASQDEHRQMHAEDSRIGGE